MQQTTCGLLCGLCDWLQEQAAAEAAAAAVGTVPGLDGPTQPGRVEVADRDQSIVAAVARLAALRAAIDARRAAASSSAAASPAADPSSSIDAVDLEMQQARRGALSRLGRDPTFWSPAATAARAGQVQQQEEEQQQPEASQRLASLRALMTAIRASAMRGEAPGQQQQQQVGDSNEAAPAGSSRQSMV
jgi:hypothetical protein